MALVDQADVLVENFLPGTMARLGLGYDPLAARNPRLIYAALSGFGQTGPYADRRRRRDRPSDGRHDEHHRRADGEPMRRHVDRRRDGRAVRDDRHPGGAARARAQRPGQLLDVSLLDSQIAILENAFARYFATGEVPGRYGTAHPLITPFQAFATADGYVVVAASSQAQWRALCGVLGRDDLCADPRFAERAARTQHRAVLVAVLAEPFAARPTDEWVARLGAVGVPCGPVNTVDAVVADPHEQARGMFVDVDVPGLGPWRAVNSPLRPGPHRSRPRRPPPRLGEHTDAVLAEQLGLDAATLAALRVEGALG